MAADDFFIGPNHGFHTQSVFTALFHEFIGRGERIGQCLFIFFRRREGAGLLFELGFFFRFDKAASDRIIFSRKELAAFGIKGRNDQRVGMVGIQDRRFKSEVFAVGERNRLAAVEKQTIFVFDVFDPVGN